MRTKLNEIFRMCILDSKRHKPQGKIQNLVSTNKSNYDHFYLAIIYTSNKNNDDIFYMSYGHILHFL